MENKKVYDFIKGNLINAIIILTALAYIFYSQVIIKRTDLTVAECIAKAGIGILVGFMIKEGMGENGMNKGYASNTWHDKLDKYSNACNLANPYIERVDNFYLCEEIEKKRNYRRTNLMNARMRYDWFFDADGNFIEGSEEQHNLTRYQKKVLKKCISVKIYNLNLFSEYTAKIGADTIREKTDKDQRAKMFGKNGFAQIVSAIIGAYFVATFENWNLGAFITATVQVCIWLTCGILQLYANYDYVTVEKTNKLTRKMELIIKFVRGCESGLYIHNPYDEVHVMQEEVKVDEEIHNTNDVIPIV